ncbi:nitrous oxide reductase accessory protein NosL [Aurantimonas sp. VKM B-3413]|nr:nitrous oxide reductase accessory protein NosL [Aurantimonas sp. VKM B-3413]
MKSLIVAAALAAALAALSACSQETDTKPLPVAMTDEAVGHYCQMYVMDHNGPKAQIHLAHTDHPLWFAQVSDAVAYLHDPERDAEIRAVYVSDMGAAPSWGAPGVDNWIDADAASYVIESQRKGGMEVPEAIPFGTRKEAEAFIAKKGGRLVSLADIPDSYVRAPAMPGAAEVDGAQSGGAMPAAHARM